MKRLKFRLFTVFSILLLFYGMKTESLAADGEVTYVGNAEKFIFAPGSKYSPTDLFPDFKNVMPGDQLTQKITLRNNDTEHVKVKLFLRALGAEEGSEGFLSKLHLTVKKSGKHTYMFDADADETAELSSWTPLGTLYSGGELDLELTLTVPIELGDNYQDRVGYLDWQFMAIEYPAESADPVVPKTGDPSNLCWLGGLVISGAVFTVICVKKKKQRD